MQFDNTLSQLKKTQWSSFFLFLLVTQSIICMEAFLAVMVFPILYEQEGTLRMCFIVAMTLLPSVSCIGSTMLYREKEEDKVQLNFEKGLLSMLWMMITALPVFYYVFMQIQKLNSNSVVPIYLIVWYVAFVSVMLVKMMYHWIKSDENLYRK